MNTRNQSLDVLRGIAVLMVILCHYSFVTVKSGIHLNRFYDFLIQLRIGVDLFFVLSGFLISGLLFSDLTQYGQIRIGRFLFRRGFKIYPPLWAFLAVSCLIWPVLRSQLLVNLAFLQNYLYLSSYLKTTHPWPVGAWGHLWSLAIEEHFYIVLPFLLMLLAKTRKLHFIPLISIALFALCFMGRLQYAAHHPVFATMMFPTHLRIDGLFAGVALGYFFHYKKEEFVQIKWWLLPLSLAILLISFITHGPDISPLLFSFDLFLTSVSFSLLMAWAVTRNLRALSPLAFIGRYSYSIYLWHIAVVYPLAAGREASLGHLFEASVASVLAGVIAGRIVEFPMLRLRDVATVPLSADRIQMPEIIDLNSSAHATINN